MRQCGCAGACGLGVLGVLLLGQALDGRDPDHVPVLLEEHHCTRTAEDASGPVGRCGMRAQSPVDKQVMGMRGRTLLLVSGLLVPPGECGAHLHDALAHHHEVTRVQRHLRFGTFEK